MAPGPTPVPPEVLAAGAAPVIHHRGPDFRELMLRTLARLREVCRTENDVLLFTASGSGAFESAVVNLALARRARARRDRWRIRRSVVCARASVRRGGPRAPVLLGRDAAARGPSLASRRVWRGGRRRRALRDLDRRGRRCPGARPRHAGGRGARRRRRRVEPRCGAARDRRLGARRRRCRLAEGADDAARTVARDRVRSRLGALEAVHDAAVLLRLGAHAGCPRGGSHAVHAGGHARRRPGRRARAAARGGRWMRRSPVMPR